MKKIALVVLCTLALLAPSSLVLAEDNTAKRQRVAPYPAIDNGGNALVLIDLNGSEIRVRSLKDLRKAFSGKGNACGSSCADNTAPKK